MGDSLLIDLLGWEAITPLIAAFDQMMVADLMGLELCQWDKGILEDMAGWPQKWLRSHGGVQDIPPIIPLDLLALFIVLGGMAPQYRDSSRRGYVIRDKSHTNLVEGARFTNFWFREHHPPYST